MSTAQSSDSFIQAPNNISLKFSRVLRSSEATFDIRGRSHSTVSASKPKSSGMIRDEYQVCRSESRKLFQVPSTEQKSINTFTFCLISPNFHSLSQNNVENPQRSLTSPKDGHDVNGKGYHISRHTLEPQGDYAYIFKADFNEISKIGFIYDEAGPEIKSNRRSREAMHKARSSCKSDLNSDHKKSDDTRIKKSADEVSTLALRKFGELFDRCDAEEGFNSNKKKMYLEHQKRSEMWQAYTREA